MEDRIFVDYRGRKIRLTAERQHHILGTHPEMAEWISKIGDVLMQPERVIQSRSGLKWNCFMFGRHKREQEKNMCVSW
jgi:hypothetical protein